ncbi:YqeG family HAD IIIA-type phosphatase [Qiania dongpingensis]|uniref:YqeG family HAD IIIA-type phosphatase n=1 Tax=Qiania dongpingensis TaxID=2763669 RepID=A0A7G9G7W6_9FIRM|nr:YqeG family HAD IIIA-type phosphatase [Qiania dongpingensis]QNM06898.1 YqeG family HAD IIIA-type phosphatase [Qiania dongpingensis]
MFGRFYPDEYVDSSYGIDYEALWARGIRGLLFDIDNTLVPHGKPETKDAVALFARLHDMGFETCLISNNQEPRVAPFGKAMNSRYLYNAHKPSRKNYRRAMEEMGTDVSTTVFVGDQLFTDVYGAKRCGIYSILVNPIHPKEEIQIVLKRYLERVVLHFYKKSLKN